MQGVLDRFSDEELGLVEEAMKLLLRGVQEVGEAQPEVVLDPAG